MQEATVQGRKQDLQPLLARLPSALCSPPALFLHLNTLPLRGGTEQMAQHPAQMTRGRVLPLSSHQQSRGGQLVF